jgi:hypothetical protein
MFLVRYLEHEVNSRTIATIRALERMTARDDRL